MNIKADIILYNGGNRAAEMRLASFVQECERNLDMTGLQMLSGASGKLKLLVSNAINNVKIKAREREKSVSIKRQLKLKLAQIDQIWLNNKEANRNRNWVPLLREAAKLRWTVKPDQEMYNIDLEIRNKIIKAATLGVKI